MTNQIIPTITNNCKRLSSIKLSGLAKVIDDECLIGLSILEELNELDISLCSKITDKGLEAFYSKIENVKEETEKNNLNSIISNNYPSILSKKSSNNLNMVENIIIPENKKFIKLNLTGLLKITNLGINSLIKTSIHSLEVLTLSLLPQKQVDSGICDSLSNCRKLRHLDLSGCLNLSDFDIQAIFNDNSFENLNSLNISGLNKISDASLSFVINSCKFLKVLRISNCPNISDISLDILMNSNSSLDLYVLEINRTPLISDKKINEILKLKSPNLRVIRACNMVWNKDDIGYRIPLIPKDYVKPLIKGSKKPAIKKNEDKNPTNQLKKILQEVKPKKAVDFNI